MTVMTCTPRAGKSVQVDRQGRHERLSLTGLHLGNPAEVKCHPAHELDIEVALANGAHTGLAHNCEGLDQKVVQVLALAETLSELDRLVRQLVVRQKLYLRLERIDRRHDGLKTAHLLAFAHAKYLPEHTHDQPLYAATSPLTIASARHWPGV